MRGDLDTFDKYALAAMEEYSGYSITFFGQIRHSICLSLIRALSRFTRIVHVLRKFRVAHSTSSRF